MLRLDPYIVAGELSCRRPYAVHGWLRLRGSDRLLILQLTGRCDSSLVGKRFRFDLPPTEANAPELRDDSFAWQQVGPVVAVSPGDVEQATRRDAATPANEPAAAIRGLHLQWQGQNGQVVVDLPEARIEFVPPKDSTADTSNDPLDSDAPLSVFWEDDDEDWLDDVDGLAISPEDLDDFDDEDPYGLLPSELKDQFEIEAFETDMALPDEYDEDGEDSEPWQFDPSEFGFDDEIPDDQSWRLPSEREPEAIDDWTDTGPAVPLSDLFETPLLLPVPDELTDKEVEPTLKVLLGALAQFGVSIRFCEHLSPHDAYRLLVEKVCAAEHVYPELRGTQWVHTVYLSEYCDQCGRQMRIDPIDADLFGRHYYGDDDIPF